MSASALLPGEGKSVTLGPNSIGVVFKLYSEDTGGQFAMVEHPLPPGTLVQPHLHHNEDEYSYVLEGEVAFQLGEEVIYGTPGMLIVKPRVSGMHSGIRARHRRAFWKSLRLGGLSDSSKRSPSYSRTVACPEQNRDCW